MGAEGDVGDEAAVRDFSGVSGPPAMADADARHMQQTKIDNFIVVIMD
jgi:hypothetical protein